MKQVDFIGNDDIMMLPLCNKLSLSWYSQKSVMLDDIFDFVVSESRDGGVSQAHNRGLLNLLFVFLFLWYFQIYLFQQKKSYGTPTTFLHPLSCEDEPQKTATLVAMAINSAVILAAISYRTSHSGICGFPNGYSPPPGTMLASLFLLLVVGGGSLADHLATVQPQSCKN